MAMKCTIKGNRVTCCRAICLASALLIFLDSTHHRSIGTQTSEIVSPNAVIEIDPNLILGFPAVVKVRFTGPVYVPDLSINSIFADLAAVFVSKSDGSTFTIQSIGPEQQFLVQFQGGLVHPQPRWILIPEGEKRDLIFDLCYLKPRGSAFPQLRQIPPGKYSLYLQFGQGQVHPDELRRYPDGCRVRLSGLHTKAVPVTLIEPSRKEKEFLQCMKKQYRLIPWQRALRRREIPSEELADVSPTAKRQIGFHLFLSQVLTSKIPVGELSVDKLILIPVPKYLEPEKNVVLLEIEKATDKPGAEKRITDFVKDNPGQGWRFRNVGPDEHFEGGYLRYKQISTPTPPKRADETEINIAAIVSEMMEQARNRERIVGISKDQLKAADPNRMLVLLAHYEKDTDWVVRRLALRYGVQLADAHPVPEIRQEVTRRLVEASITGSVKQAGKWSMNFTAKDFGDQSKSLIQQALTRANKGKVGGDLSVWLCGVANMQDQLPRLKELMIDELSYRNDPNMKHFPKWYYTTGWAARLARARMGVKEDIEKCIQLVEKEKNLDRRITILLPKIAYIRRPQAIECLREYFLSDERLSPTNPGALGTPVSKYLMSELADCLVNFPVKKRAARNYKDTEINLCRKWMKRQEEWEIRR